MCRYMLTEEKIGQMRAFFLAVLCAVFGLATEQPVRELSTQAIPFPVSIVPPFRHGYLILFPPGGDNGVSASTIMYGFYTYGPDGHFAYQKSIELLGGDVDFDTDSNAAVGAGALVARPGL
jgi:hypothetical protein